MFVTQPAATALLVQQSHIDHHHCGAVHHRRTNKPPHNFYTSLNACAYLLCAENSLHSRVALHNLRIGRRDNVDSAQHITHVSRVYMLLTIEQIDISREPYGYNIWGIR